MTSPIERPQPKIYTDVADLKGRAQKVATVAVFVRRTNSTVTPLLQQFIDVSGVQSVIGHAADLAQQWAIRHSSKRQNLAEIESFRQARTSEVGAQAAEQEAVVLRTELAGLISKHRKESLEPAASQVATDALTVGKLAWPHILSTATTVVGAVGVPGLVVLGGAITAVAALGIALYIRKRRTQNLPGPGGAPTPDSGPTPPPGAIPRMPTQNSPPGSSPFASNDATSPVSHAGYSFDELSSGSPTSAPEADEGGTEAVAGPGISPGTATENPGSSTSSATTSNNTQEGQTTMAGSMDANASLDAMESVKTAIESFVEQIEGAKDALKTALDSANEGWDDQVYESIAGTTLEVLQSIDVTGLGEVTPKIESAKQAIESYQSSGA